MRAFKSKNETPVHGSQPTRNRADSAADGAADNALHLKNPAPTFARLEARASGGTMALPSITGIMLSKSQTQCIRYETFERVALKSAHFIGGARPQVIRGWRDASQAESHNVEMGVTIPGPGPLGPGVTTDTSGKVVGEGLWTERYVVLGLFSPIDGIPREKMVFIRHSERIFRDLFWAIVRLRGLRGLFSLKDVRTFAIYKVNCVFSLNVMPVLYSEKITFYSVIGRRGPIKGSR
jgi:hypothetical protein